jgi:hypothetical protein
MDKMKKEENNVKYIGFGSPLMDMIADVNQELINK